MRSQRHGKHCINPFYIGPYPERSCGCCPYGIFSGYLPCGWSTCCTDPNKINKCKNCIQTESKDDCKAEVKAADTKTVDEKDGKREDAGGNASKTVDLKAANASKERVEPIKNK